MKTKKPKRRLSETTFKRKIENVCKFLRWHFYANAYGMNLVWCLDEVKKNGDMAVSATIEIDTRYLEFTITFYKTIYETWCRDPAECFLVLVHEFCHLITEPIYKEVYNYAPEKELYRLHDLREHVTSLMAKILIGTESKRVYELVEALK